MLVLLACKRCAECGEMKIAELGFYAAPGHSRDGYRSKCRDCWSLWYKANRDEIAARQKEYYQANRARRLAYQNEYDRARANARTCVPTHGTVTVEPC